MRRALILVDGGAPIDVTQIVFDPPARMHRQASDHAGDPPQTSANDLAEIVQLSEARAIYDTLRACGGKRIEAARRLGISERTLRYRLASYRDAGLVTEQAS